MNKSNASSQLISLPKGGGALHGMGEKFSPDLQTGTGNFTVPLALPFARSIQASSPSPAFFRIMV